MVNDNNGWIRCDERLPEMDTPVFAGRFSAQGVFMYHVFMRSDSCGEGWIWSFSNSDMISDNDDFIEDDDYSMITHWQPMLEAPTK